MSVLQRAVSIIYIILVNVCSEFNAHALGALAEVAGSGLNVHLNTVLPALLSAMSDDNVVCGISSIWLPFPTRTCSFFLY